MNHRIRVPEVRVVDSSGTLVGVMPTKEALALAKEQGLDLVEVSPKSRPPVCRIMDYGKYCYEQSKKAQKAKKRQHAVRLKEIRFRPKIEEHDFQFKLRNARRFLEDRDKVKFGLIFRGREVTHSEIGRRILDRLASDLADISSVESGPKMEGRSMVMVLMPRLAAQTKPAGESSGGAESKSAPSVSNPPAGGDFQPKSPQGAREAAPSGAPESRGGVDEDNA